MCSNDSLLNGRQIFPRTQGREKSMIKQVFITEIEAGFCLDNQECTTKGEARRTGKGIEVHIKQLLGILIFWTSVIKTLWDKKFIKSKINF